MHKQAKTAEVHTVQNTYPCVYLYLIYCFEALIPSAGVAWRGVALRVASPRYRRSVSKPSRRYLNIKMKTGVGLNEILRTHAQ